MLVRATAATPEEFANGRLPQRGGTFNSEQFGFAEAFLRPVRFGPNLLPWNRKGNENNKAIRSGDSCATVSYPLNLEVN